MEKKAPRALEAAYQRGFLHRLDGCGLSLASVINHAALGRDFGKISNMGSCLPTGELQLYWQEAAGAG